MRGVEQILRDVSAPRLRAEFYVTAVLIKAKKALFPFFGERFSSFELFVPQPDIILMCGTESEVF